MALSALSDLLDLSLSGARRNGGIVTIPIDFAIAGGLWPSVPILQISGRPVEFTCPDLVDMIPVLIVIYAELFVPGKTMINERSRKCRQGSSFASITLDGTAALCENSMLGNPRSGFRSS